MIKLVPYKKSLLKGWVYDGIEEYLFRGPDDVLSCIDDYCMRGRGIIGYGVRNDIIGVSGMFPLNKEGKGYAWSFINRNATPYGLEMIRTIRELQDEFAGELGINNLVTETDVNCPELTKYMMLLGYERESVLLKRGPHGEDMNYFTKKVRG